MKISGYIIKALLAVFALSFAVSCERETGTEDKGETTANIRLVLLETNVPGSRAFGGSDSGSGLTVRMDRPPVSTRADDEIEVINDVWVLQFGPTGMQPVAPVYLSGSQLESITAGVPGEVVSYKLDVTLVKSSDCTLWFVGNTGNSSLFSQGMTLEEFNGLTIPVANESEVKQHINKATGYYRGAVDKSTVINVPMYRLVSKVSITVTHDDPLPNDPYDAFLKLSTLQLRSVPKTISYTGGTGADYRFPLIVAGTPEESWNSGFMNYDVIYSEDLRYLGTVTWYVPENIRGINGNVTSEMKKWSGTDPSWESPRSFATHAVMEGDYNYISGEVPIKGMAEVTIYPGDNVTDDFNVARNSHYAMNAGITKMQGWELADYGDPLKDNRVVVRVNPYITYKYYYEGEPYDSEMSPYYYMGQSYRWQDVVLGGSYSANLAVRNAFKGRIPVEGDYENGRVEDGKEPLVASADNAENVVNIFYDKVSTEVFYVRYYPNYPDGSGDVIPDGPHAGGSTVTIIPGLVLGFSYSGYGQRGYNTNADGSGITYTEGDMIILESDLDLYAQWQPDA